MKPLIELELRKHLLTGATLATCCLLLPPACALIATITGSNSFIWSAKYGQMALLGLAALIVGGGCGADCRRDNGIEEHFPANPATRLFSALTAAGLLFAALFAIGFLSFTVTAAYYEPCVQELLYPAAAASFALLGYTFALSYLLETPSTAAMLALILLAPNLGALVTAEVLNSCNIDGGAALAVASLLTAVPAAAGLLLLLARTMLRHKKLSLNHKTAAVALILLPPLCGVLAYFNTNNLFKTALVPQMELPFLADTKPASGIVAQTLYGVNDRHDAFFLTPDGKRTILIGFIQTSTLWSNIAKYPGITYFFTPAGEVWLRTNENGEIYHGNPDRALSGTGIYYWGDTNTIAAGQEGHIYTLYQADGADYYYTKIERHNSWRDEHKYPVLKTVFTVAMDAFAPSELPVLTKNAKQPVATPPVSAYRKLMGGGYAVYYDGKLYSMTQDRRANRPFAIALPPQTRILRAETNAVRILRGSELITMDATTGQQTVSAALKLPPDNKYPNDIRTCGDGIFVFNRGKVTFYDWNGHSKKL